MLAAHDRMKRDVRGRGHQEAYAGLLRTTEM